MSPLTRPEPALLQELADLRSPTAPGLLSKAEKDRLIERAFATLYRWYVSRSQTSRNWNPDTSFKWPEIRLDHAPAVQQVVEGFFAIEQYVPDYVATLLQRIRQSYGRSHFHIRWGAEEEKHADAWQNAVLFMRHRTPQWLRDYTQTLRQKEWRLPWEDGLHMAFYTVLQERATQLNYLRLQLIATGKSPDPAFAHESDPILAEVAQTIAVDEAAHYNFFMEMARLFLYYYPAQALEALGEVIQHFSMPAIDLLPDSQAFYEAALQAGVYGPRDYARDVLQAALDNLSVAGRRALFDGLKRFRQVPDLDGHLRDTAIFEALDYEAVQTAVQRLFGRLQKFEAEIGLDQLDPLTFVPSGLSR